jgi:hypothetical protein
MRVIVGREGSGKSHTALKIASTIDPDFSPDRVIFDVSDLLRDLQEGDDDPGTFYVLDEAGVQLGRRTWQERGQVLANQALQLIRNHNLGLIFILPRLGELDSQTQGRLQAFYEITEKVEGECVRGKWKWLDPDRADQTGTIYKKYPRRRQDGALKRIESIAFTPPEPGIVEPYEHKKRSFQEEFYEETIDALNDGEGGDSDEGSRSLAERAQKIANNGVDKYISAHNQTGEPYIDSDLLYAEKDLTIRESRALKKMIEDRVDLEGYTRTNGAHT